MRTRSTLSTPTPWSSLAGGGEPSRVARPAAHAHRSPTHAKTPAPKFGGGFGTAVVKAMEFIDQNKVIELLITDVGLMVAPRTFIEWRKRGGDMAREAFLREICGTISMIFMMGFIGKGAQVIYDNIPGLNKGVFAGAWINDGYMQELKHSFDQALKNGDGKTVGEIRETFIQDILKRLYSTDDSLREGVANSLNPNRKGELELKSILRPQEGPLERLTSLFGISPDQNSKQGLVSIDDRLKERLGVQTHAEARNHPRWWAERKALSADELKFETGSDGLISKMKKILNDSAASDSLHLALETEQRDRLLRLKKTLKMDQDQALTGLKHFLEQIGDRALTEGLEDRAALADALRGGEHVFNLEKAGKVADDLVRHARGSKAFLTWLPLVATIVFAMSVPSINNWITRRKHGLAPGQDFFPGEGVPPSGQAVAQSVATPASGETSMVGAPVSRLARGGNPFEVFERRSPVLSGGGA